MLIVAIDAEEMPTDAFIFLFPPDVTRSGPSGLRPILAVHKSEKRDRKISSPICGVKFVEKLGFPISLGPNI